MSATLPTILPIKKIIPEAEGIKTFVFDFALDATPGQFVMAWLPRVDEKPFSVWTDDPRKFYLTVSAVGPFSKKLHELKVGDKVGFRGPFGHGFTIPDSANNQGINSSVKSVGKSKKIILIGGGFGTAPLLFLAEEAKDCEIDFIIGARNKALLFGEKQARQISSRVHIATDDGSQGVKGFNVAILEELLAQHTALSIQHSVAPDPAEPRTISQKPLVIYSCGPERMMYRVAEICQRFQVPCELSLERYMKCGFGVCGACALDDTGWRACRDGPVIAGEQALQLAEFGKYKRDSVGTRINF